MSRITIRAPDRATHPVLDALPEWIALGFGRRMETMDASGRRVYLGIDIGSSNLGFAFVEVVRNAEVGKEAWMVKRTRGGTEVDSEAPRPVAMVARVVAAARLSILSTMGAEYADANARTVRSDVLIAATLRTLRAIEPVLNYFQPRVVVIEKQPGGNRESIASGSPFSLKMNDIATAIQSYFLLLWADRMDRISTQSTARKAKGMQCWTTQLYYELHPPKASRARIPRALVPDWAAAGAERKRARGGEAEEEEDEVVSAEGEGEDDASSTSEDRTVISLLDDEEEGEEGEEAADTAAAAAAAAAAAPEPTPPPLAPYDHRKHDANKATSVACLLAALRDTHGPIHRLPVLKRHVPDACAPRWRLVDAIHLHDRMRRMDPRMAKQEGSKFDDIADAFWHAISAVCEDEGWIPAPSAKL